MKKIEKEIEERQMREWFEAVRFQNIKTIKKMIEEGVDVNLQDSLGWTALYLACDKANLDLILFLINNGADVNAKDDEDWTILHEVCFRGGYYKIAQLLIEKGADVNAKNENFRTPLHIACSYGDIEIAKLLIDNGADVIIKDKNGSIPLDDLKPYKEKHEELMQWLSENHPEKALEVMASENSQSKGVEL